MRTTNKYFLHKQPPVSYFITVEQAVAKANIKSIICFLSLAK